MILLPVHLMLAHHLIPSVALVLLLTLTKKFLLKLTNNEISDLNLKCASVSALEQKVMLSCNRMHDQHRNDMKKLKRRNKKIEEYKKENTETKKTLSQMEVQLHKNDYRIAELKKSIDRIRHRADYCKSDIKQESEEEIIKSSINIQEVNTKLYSDIKQLEEKNANLEEQVHELMVSLEDSTLVTTYDGGKH